MIIYLDMDGVCCDFVGAACETVRDKNAVYPEIEWPDDCSDLTKVLGIAPSLFWELIDAEGVSFWRGLTEYNWFNVLYSGLQSYGRVIFCSTPSYSPHSVTGKLEWLQYRFGMDFRDYIFITDKSLLASPHSILIDDFDLNINEYRECGGDGVLFPAPWNANRALYCDNGGMLAYVFGEVKTIADAMNSVE